MNILSLELNILWNDNLNIIKYLKIQKNITCVVIIIQQHKSSPPYTLFLSFEISITFNMRLRVTPNSLSLIKFLNQQSRSFSYLFLNFVNFFLLFIFLLIGILDRFKSPHSSLVHFWYRTSTFLDAVASIFFIGFIVYMIITPFIFSIIKLIECSIV